MKCLKCGAELIGTEKFCYDCGSEVVKEEAVVVPNNVETATEVEIVTPVEQSTVAPQEVVEPVATPVVEQVVSENPEVNVAPVAEANANTEATEKPVTEEAMADIMEGEPKKGNSKPLVIVALILLIVVILAGLFMTFKDYFIKEDSPKKDPVVEQPKPEVEDKIKTLTCNLSGTDQIKSTISITYNNSKATYYDVRYTLDVTGLTEEQATSSREVLGKHVIEVSKFQGNAGFNYNYVSPTEGVETETVSSLSYTVAAENVTNNEIYNLLQGMTGTEEEAKTTIQNNGYVCE